LKPVNPEGFFSQMEVAPFAGAWIETKNWWLTMVARVVAPFAGAWIETDQEARFFPRPTSRPSRARGLKQYWGAVAHNSG